MPIVAGKGTGKLHLENLGLTKAVNQSDLVVAEHATTPPLSDDHNPAHGGMFRLCPTCDTLYCASRLLPSGGSTLTFKCPICLMDKMAVVLERALNLEAVDDEIEELLVKYHDWKAGQDH